VVEQAMDRYKMKLNNQVKKQSKEDVEYKEYL